MAFNGVNWTAIADFWSRILCRDRNRKPLSPFSGPESWATKPCSSRLGNLDCEFACYSKDPSIASFAWELERLEQTKPAMGFAEAFVPVDAH
jgi:hypothetical protein